MRLLILSFNFIIAATLFVSAQSDDCTAATMLGAADLTSGTMVSETTLGNTDSGFWGGVAPQMDLTCDVSNMYTIDEWWRIDIASGNDIMIDITSGTNHMVAIVEATTPNCLTPNMNTFLGCMDQSITTSFIFENCFSAGGVYYIVVLTDVANQGPYDLTVTEILSTGTSALASGDNCMTAISLDPVIDGTDGTTITCGADNINGTSINNFQEAKGDDLGSAGCIETNEASVWYSFTAGDDVYIENTTSVDLSIALYSGSCGSLVLINCDVSGNIQEVDALVPGDTYYVQVAFPYGFDGTFDFCLNSPLLPMPDNCATPEMLALVDGVTTNAVQMDNFGATSTAESFTPSLIGPCGTGSFSTNYYQFTIGGVGNTHVNINYNETGASPITNSQITILTACTDAIAFNGYEWTGDTDENICLMPGTYYIQIASCDADEGDYTLALTPNTPPTNDACAAADLFNDPVTLAPVAVVPPICEVYNVVGTTVNACPEASNLGSTCAFDTESTVWFTFTTNAIATQEAEITLNPSGATPIVSGMFALLTGPCDGTLVGTCQTDFNEANINLSPNTQYYIAVSQQAIGGITGTFDLDLEISSTPTNDDCVLGSNPDILLATTGTTNCADYEVNTCGIADPVNDHQVFYMYTNGTGSNVDLEITITADGTNGNPATQVSITALENDCTTFTGFYPGVQTNSEWCDILGSGMQTLPCIEDGETVILIFSSLEGDEGDFMITANEGGMQPVDNNDECTSAYDITPATTCQWFTVTADNNNACPEDFGIAGGCDFNMDPTVWYSFTVPAAAGDYTLEIQNILDASSYLTIFDAGIDCDAPVSTALNADCESDAGPHDLYDPLIAGTTYLIAFGNPNPGIYSFEIKINLLPSNDECDGAIALVGGTPTLSTTTCAIQETIPYDSGVCTDPDEENTVWFEYTVPAGDKGFNLTITGAGTVPITMGDINAVVFETTALACTADASTFIDEDCLTLATLTEQFECVGEGTYIIRISTSDMNSGEFEILVDPLTAIMFDVCSDPDAATFAPALDCEWMPGVAVTIDACPEAFDFASDCGFDDFPVIWYEIVAPATATMLDLQTVSSTAGDPFIAIFEGLPADCDDITSGNAVAGSNCYSGIFADLEAAGSTQIDVVGGSTYYIGIGSNDLNGSTINFEIKWITPPANDECVGAVALTANTATMGTTLCATQATIPYNSAVCTDADETNTVWYEVTVGPGEKGFNLTITGAGADPITMGDINTVVFETTAAGCVADASTFVDEVCMTLATVTDQFECVGEGTYVIRISTSEANSGDFDILFEPIAAINFDVCSDPDADTFNPVIDCEWMPATAVTIDACPEAFDFVNNCGFDDFPVIWYEVTAPANATELDLMTVSSTAGTPFIAVFEGLPADCDDITSGNAVAGSNCYSGLFADLDTEGSGTIDVVGGTTYYIGIGSDDVNGSSIVFEIKFITPPLNDECVDGVVLSNGVSVMGTTTCATQATIPFDSGVCTDPDEENTVWYEFTVPDGVNGFDVTVTATAVGGLTGDVNIVVFESTAVGCVADASTFEDEVCATSAMLVEDFECIGPGTYVIRISTSEANEGAFDILIEEYTSPVVNDMCSNPTVINIEPECEWYPVDANTVDACPEQFDFASDCGFDDFPVVWYEINVTDDNATEIQINLISSATGNAFYSVFNGNPADCEDLTPASVSGFCETTLGQNTVDIDIEANGPMTYLIGVGADAVGGSASIQFEIKIIVPPLNDDPCDAELVTTAGDINTTVMGTTTCATMDLDEVGCEPTAVDENSVWYEYTIPAGTTGFIVTLVSTGTGQDFAVGVYEFPNGCLMNPLLLDNDVPPDCALDDGGELKFTCLDENTTAYIMVSTLDAEAGDFDLTIDPIVPDPLCIDNDLCSMADDASTISTPITDGGQVCVSDCNLEACPWEFNAGACIFTDFPTVFYTVTTDANAEDATMTVILSSADGNPIFSVIELDCDTPSSVTPESFCVEGDGAAANLSNMEVDANTTYIIVVALDEIDEEGGDFDLCVNVTTSCNDDPCSPYPLVQGDGVNGIALDCDTNIGSTAEPFDYVSTDCDDPLLFASTVYFSYTVPDNISSFTLFFTNDPVTGIQNAVGINILVYDAANCAFQQVEVVDQQCIQPGNVEPMEVDCPTSGDTYLIQITSADGDEGDFDIEITETIQDDPCAANDDCDFAMVLDVTETCEWLEFPDCNIQACPEEFFDAGMECAYNASAVVWYTFTTPDNAVTAHIELVPGGVTDPTWGLFTDNGCAVPPTAVNGDVDCVTTGGAATAIEEDIAIEANTTYYIAVGSETDIEGDFTLNIKIDVPPINDDPCINDDNPPLDLTGGGSHTGTTCCARGPKDENPDGSLADFENVDCSAATEDAAVWYMYTPDPDDDGYSIILESGGVDPSEGPIAIEVYSGVPDQGCNGGFGQTLASSCADFGVQFSIGNCLAPGEVLFIKVSTDDADENCGEFIITIVPASCGPMADDCIDLADGTPIMPITPPDFGIDPICIDGCLDFACPEDDALGGCPDFTQMPTVWFQVTADDIAAQMFTYVTPNGNWSPIWSVFSGPDCDNLSVVNFGGSPPCSNGDNTPELHQTSVFDDEENYWIMVTIDPASLPSTGLDDGSFELCIATTINAIICLGELEGGACDDESLVMEITDREIEDQPLEGPFCQGEEITVNISFFYDASESGADWLIGFVPVFGPGWDLTNFDYDLNAPVGNGQTGQWYEEGGMCAPILQEPNPILCTFTDADGNLQLCNLLCSPCSECPQPFMEEGDILPSGYFWVSNGGNAGCDNDCSPGEGWGIGSTMAQIDWEFTLPVKEFDTYEECLANNDLSISFQTFSDGTGGCWEDPVGECLLDRAMFSPAWEIECEAPPAVEGPDQEICHDGVLDIPVATLDGSTNTIIVEVDDNPNVSGEMNHTFLGGVGTIDDDLTNLTNDVQIVIYNVFSEDESLPCPGIINQIEVTIYPELMATFPPVYVCEGECTDITPDIVGGVGVPYTYEWSTGETTASINVCPVVATTYFVTVEDALGCMDVAEVQVTVAPAIELMLPESIAVCKDDSYDPFNPDYFVCLDIAGGTPGYTILWTAPPGLVLGNPYGVFGEKVPINELASSEFAGNNGQYVLSVMVTDALGCTAETDMLVNVTGELILVVDYVPIECGETDVEITATGFDSNSNPVTTFLLYGGCPDDGLGDFLEESFSLGGVVTFPTQSLLAYTCYTVVAQTESGCQTTQDITIPLTEGIPIVITGTPDICIGDDATITITNASDYSTFEWTPSSIGNTGSVTFTPDSTAIYFVEATDPTGCKSQEVFTVTVNPLPIIALSGATTFCAGGSATISASGGTIYTWTPDNGNTGDTYTTTVAGDVTLVMQDANGCESDTIITFEEDNMITVNIGGPNLCDGIEDTLFITGVYDSYSWTFNAAEVGTDSFLVVTEPGTYSVDVDAGGCPGSGEITIENYETPIIMVSDTVEVCREDSGIDSLCVNFNNQVSGSGGVWTQVDFITGFTFDPANLDNVCFEDIQAGCYAFTYTTNTAELPCMNVSETMIVCVKACPCPSPATQPIDPICNTGTTNLEFAELTSDPGTWSVESGPPGQDIASILTGTIFDANGIMAGDYVVRFTLDSPGGPACEVFTEQTITVFEAPVVTVMNGIMCNIDGQSDPIVLDLYTLISVDATDGGSWAQIGTPMVTITGADMSTIMSSDLATFPETLIFEYTSGVEAGSPCPPTIVTVEVLVRDCNCPFVNVLPDTLCNNGMAIDLNTLLENPDGLSGTWSTNGTLVGASMFDPNGLPSGQYTITFTLDSSPGPTCDLEYSNIILVLRQSEAEPAIAEPPCSADTGNGPTTSNLYDWLESGYSSGTWTQTGGSPNLPFTDNGLDMAVVDFAGYLGQPFEFTFSTDDAQDPCTNVDAVITITPVDCNCPPIVLDPAPDLCNDSGMMDLCALTDGSDDGIHTVASIGGTDISDRITGCIFDATGLNPGEYVLTFTLNETVTGICEQFLQDTFTVSEFRTTTIMDPPKVCNDENGNGLLILNFTDWVDNAGVGIWEDTDGSGVAIATLPEQMSVSFTDVDAGTYTFTYRIDNDEPCPDVVLTMEVIVEAECNCEPINPLNPEDECNTDGPIDLTQYDDPLRAGIWSSTDLTVENGNSLLIDGVTSGTYILTYTVMDTLPECPDSAVVMIFIGEPANAGIAAEPYQLCEGVVEIISLADLLDGEDAGGTWTETSSTLSGGFSAVDATLTTSGETAGTYTFEYTISANDPCPLVSETVTVIIDPKPVADAGDEMFIDCINSSALLGGTATTEGTDIEYTWVDTNTGEVVGTSLTLQVGNEGIFELTVLNTATDCMDRDIVEVMKSDDLPTMDVEAIPVRCFNEDNGGVTLTNQDGGDGNYTYSLNGGDAIADPSDILNLPAGDYTITIIDGIGCESEPYPFTVIEPAEVLVEAGPDIIVGEVGETFDLSILPFDTSTVTSIVWSNAETTEIICSGLNCTSIVVTPTLTPTNYYVEVMNANGCSDNDNVQIQLEQIVDVVFPNILTPNGDNVNDRFFVASKDVETIISMKIFDRWGEKLYDQGNFPPRDPELGWDGKFKGKKVVPGVYVFTVELLFVTGETETFNGDVTVTDSE